MQWIAPLYKYIYSIITRQRSGECAQASENSIQRNEQQTEEKKHECGQNSNQERTQDHTNRSSATGTRRVSYGWLEASCTTELTQWQREFKAIDWRASPLGPIASWEPWLKRTVLILMTDITPSLLFIDGQEGISIAALYNEEMLPSLGVRHPILQGNDPKKILGHQWHLVGSMVARGRDSDHIMCGEEQHNVSIRHGHTEDTWWTYRSMPIPNGNGSFGASYMTCCDIESQIISVLDTEQLWKEISRELELASSDVPCALLYCKRADDSSHFELISVVGLPEDHTAPDLLDASIHAPLELAIKQAIDSGVPSVLPTKVLSPELISLLRSRQHQEQCRELAVCPLQSTRHQRTFGFILLGADPRALFTADSKIFFAAISRRLSSVFARQSLDQQLELQKGEIEERDRRFASLASRAPMGISIMAPDGRLQYTNGYWYELIKWLPRPIDEPKAWMNRVCEEDRPMLRAAWEDVNAGREQIKFHFRLLTNRRSLEANDPEGLVTVMCRLFTDRNHDGSMKNIMCCLVDISDIKDLECQLRARTDEVEMKMAHLLEVKKQQEKFIDMTSHEIRNPLSAVLHLAEDVYSTTRDALQSLQRSAEEIDKELLGQSLESSKDSAETIMSCVLHQKRIVDDILVVSRLESGALVVTAVPTQPKNLIQKALRMFEAEARSSNTTLSFVEDASLETLNIHTLLFDSSRIVQILVNLVGNAIKFTKLEEVRSIKVIMAASLVRPSDKASDIEYISVTETSSVQISEGEGEVIWLSLSVVDTGRGLSPTEKQQLFKRFSQVTRKTHTQYGGSGLGLSIAKQLTEIHGGQIGLASAKHQGSHFTFFIRTVRCAAPDSRTSSSAHAKVDPDLIMRPPHLALPSPTQSSAGNGMLSILVVEDNIVNQKILVHLLSKRGCKVHVANHGLEALVFLKKTCFYKSAPDEVSAQLPLSIILLDLEMPVMDGITTVKKIREMESAGELIAHVPILAVTANARAEQLTDMLEAGMDSCITKPYQIPEMMRKIHELAFQPEESG